MTSSTGSRHPRTWAARYAAVVLILGLAVFTSSPATAFAEPGTDSGTSSSQSESSTGGAKDSSSTTGGTPKAGPSDSGPSTATSGPGTSTTTDPDNSPADEDTTPSTTGQDDTPAAPSEPEPSDVEPSDAEQSGAEPVDAETPESPSPETPVRQPASTPTNPPAAPASGSTNNADPSPPAASGDATRTPPRDIEVASESAADSALVSATTDRLPAAERRSTLAVTDSPPVAARAALEDADVAPEPVSPIAQLAALPGRIINAFLQLVGITTSAGAGPSPISPAPIADLFFAVFRRIEEALGLHAPVVQPVPPTMVYDGPVDRPTPTVAQFLNASSAEYVLGGTPAGMVPFTVNGWPLASLHLETGSDASVWVTPQNQIIIAYSGTTGGTNLLFNPLIAITQIITDLEAGLGSTTPLAFTQAVAFAERVKAEAALQGYATDDVFVTGHSLGAWQAQYVAQQIGLAGIGFEGPGLNSTVPGNGADSLFVNVATYGDMANFLSSDLPGLNPIAPPYVPGGGLKPHYGPIVLLGDPAANTPMVNAAALFGKGILGTLISGIDLLGNFFAKHLPGVQAYHLDVDLDPGVVPWLGINEGPVYTGFGELTIQEFLKAASDKGLLVAP